MKKEEAQRKLPIHLFSCDACKDSEAMEHKPFIEHLKTVHGISGQIKGKKQMMMHLDMKDSYSSTYAWSLEESALTFQEYYEGERAKDDMMRFDD